MSEEKIEQSFQVSQPAKLNVSNIRGRIEIITGDEDVIQVTAVKHTGTGDDENTQIEITQDENGAVRVATRFPEKGWNGLFSAQPCKVEYVIKAPKNCELKVKGVSSSQLISGFEADITTSSVSGDLTIKNLAGSLKAKSVSGDIRIDVFTGTLSVDSVSGDIKGQQISGSVNLGTTSGRVELNESDLPSVQAKTVSGNMKIFTGLHEGPYSFKSISGDVRLVVPSDTRCSAEISSISGRISTSLPQSSSSRNRGSQHVDIQGGGVKVSLKSVSGELSLAS